MNTSLEERFREKDDESSQSFFLSSKFKLPAKEKTGLSVSAEDPLLDLHQHQDQSGACSLSDNVPLLSYSRLATQSSPKSYERSQLSSSISPSSQPLLPGPIPRGPSMGGFYRSNHITLTKAEVIAKIPWSVERQVNGNGGLKNAVMRSQSKNIIDDVLWVGSIGPDSGNLPENTMREIDSKLRSEYQCCPVFLDDDTLDGHYNRYCKQILWPTLHYEIPDNPKSKAYQDHSWEHYRSVNQSIAQKIVDCYKKGDTIWVNDYHLLLVPNMIREKLPDAKIGFFLHVSFPSSEVFRCLSTRKELLEGMLGADCIGFQTPEHARHFLQTCNRILTVDTTPTSVRLKQTSISVVVQSIGIDIENLQLSCKENEVLEWRKMIRERWPKSKLIVARDKLDKIRGVKQKLLAYEQFLLNHPEMIGSTVLIQVCQMNKPNHHLERDVITIIDRINSLQSNLASEEPCVFLHKDIGFPQYVALLQEADAFAVTSVREGMNLTCHEFIFCNTTHSPLILSEFTGAAAVLGPDTILVNPWDKTEMAEAFYLSLTMDAAEKERRWSALNSIVTSNTCCKWVKDFLSDVDASWTERQRRQLEVIPVLNAELVSEDYKKTPGYRVFYLDFESSILSIERDSHNLRSHFRRRGSASSIFKSSSWTGLSPSNFTNLYEGRPSSSPSENAPTPSQFSHKHTFSLGSTLESHILFHSGARYSSHTTYLSPQRKLSLLAELVSDPHNIVYVASSNTKETLEQMFKQVPSIGLIAENGACMRPCGIDEWQTLNDYEEAPEWHKMLEPLLNRAGEQLPGSQLDIKGSKITLSFSKCTDQARVESSIGELLSHVNDGFEMMDVHAFVHDRKVEISSNIDMKLTAIKWAFKTELENLSRFEKDERGEIGMVFIAAESGKTENDHVFEWGNSLVNGVHDMAHWSPALTPNSAHSRTHSSTHSRSHSVAQNPSPTQDALFVVSTLEDAISSGSDLLSWDSDRVDTFSTIKHTFQVPIVYTVSVGGTGTYAQYMVDGINGLLNSLEYAIKPLGK